MIQIWVTSNIATVESKHKRGSQWLSAIISAVLGPGVSSEKFKKAERVLSWKRVLWGTVFPFAFLGWITTSALLWQQFQARYRGRGGIATTGEMGYFRNSTTTTTTTFNSSQGVYGGSWEGFESKVGIRVVMLVTSSWTDRSRVNRDKFRRSTVKMFPPPSSSSSPSKPGQFSIVYKFLLGTAPSPQQQTKKSPLLQSEAKEFGDLLFLSAHDGYEDLSKKIWEGWNWAAGMKEVDYVLKTDDDIFLRMDIISKELIQLGRREDYWKGFAYWAIPTIQDSSNKNADFSYSLNSFPPYTAGALHILSHNLVRYIATTQTHRKLFVKNEDQNLGIWLFPTGILPIHDYRIQQGQICSNTMIAKHFGGNYLEAGGIGPVEMFENLQQGKKLCEGGFDERWCGVCWPSCLGKENHWRDWGFSCDEIKGATLTSSLKSSVATTVTQGIPIKTEEERMVMGSQDDPWVLPGILSKLSSPFATTDDWHLLHMLCWTTPASTFQERHYQAIETIWVHEPRAILFVMASELELDFFKVYTDAGYAIHVVRIGGPELLEMGWYLGDHSRAWLMEWDKWATGPYLFVLPSSFLIAG